MTVALLCLLACSSVATAGGDASDSDKVSKLEERVKVRGEPDPSEETLETDAIDDARVVNMGLALESLPGIAVVRRAANAAEPVIRGLGWERVQTQVNGLPLHGACPARMDAPACIVGRCPVQNARVVKGLGSVTLGPAGTGGRLELSTEFDRGGPSGREIAPWMDATYDGARDGFHGAVGFRGGLESIDIAAGAEILRHNDYSSAGGTTVPAGQDEIGSYLSVGRRLGSSGRWRLGLVTQDGEDIDYPSLPMNSEEAKTRVYDFGYRFWPERVGGSLSELAFRLGYADVSHLMSNRGKPNRVMTEAETESDAATWSAGVTSLWQVLPESTLEFGADYLDLERDALRERYVVASETLYHDHLWPEVSQEDTGVFAEYRTSVAGDWKLRFGLRYDRVASAAAAADDPGFGGRTVRESYEYFYGPEASETDRDENLLSGNILVSRDLGPDWSVHGGVGVVSRAASMTERYFSFAPAPGGYLIGNPTLDAERKQEIAAGFRYRGDRVDLDISAFRHDVADFIHRVLDGTIDVTGDGNPDGKLFEFHNVDAILYGAEVSTRLRIGERWSIPASLAFVVAEDDDTGDPLHEIPPLEGSATVRYAMPGKLAQWIELGGRFVDDQDRVDPGFPEDATPGFAVWHARAGLDLGHGIELLIGFENLLDKEYNEHLTREAIMPVGDLAAGGEIPQPGRSVLISVRYR